MKKNDFILIVVILMTALAGFGIHSLRKTGEDAQIVIKADGEEYGRYNLNEDQVIKIGDTNILTVTDGKADMTDASCPDKLCVHQKAVSKEGESIICLPNKVIVTVENGKQSELDAVSN